MTLNPNDSERSVQMAVPSSATLINSSGGNVTIHGGIFTLNVTSGDPSKHGHERDTDSSGDRDHLAQQNKVEQACPIPGLGPLVSATVPSETSGHLPARLLSIDGGGIRGLSALIILEEIMHRLKFKQNLPHPPKPCEVFDLAGGAGTGGLVVIMLFRLRMSVGDAKDAYVRFMKSVFSEKKRWFWQETTFKTSQLEEELIKLLSEQLGDGARMEQMVDKNSPKCFVCATPTQQISQPSLFRTWDGQRLQRNVTILEAARATCTIPGLFKDAEIDNGGVKETFIDAGYRCNNPVNYVVREAELLGFIPSCIVSLGTGLESIIELPKPDNFQRGLSTQLIQVFKSIAQDCERTAEETAREYRGKTDFYFRFNVDRGMQDITLAEWEKLGDVLTHSNQYLGRHEVSQKVDTLVNVLHCSLPPS